MGGLPAQIRCRFDADPQGVVMEVSSSESLQASMKKLEEQATALHASFDRLSAASQHATDMAQSAHSLTLSRKRSCPLARIAGSIEILTQELSDELGQCSHLQAAQLI